MTSSCSSCGAPMRWERTVRGRAIPLNPDPDPERGNVQLAVVGGEEIAVVLGPADVAAAQIASAPLYLSHFVSCPNAGEHRRRGRETRSRA